MDTGNNTAGKTAPERYVSEKAFEELPDTFQKLAELLGEDQFELVAVNDEKDPQDQKAASESSFSEEIAESLFSSTGDTSLVTDLDKIVAAAGFDKTFYSDKLLLQKVADIFQKRTTRTVFLPDGYAITGDDTNEYKMQIFAPVVVAGDVTGGVILLSKSEKNVAEKTKLAEFSAKILANSLQ